MKIKHYSILAILALLFVFGAVAPTFAQTASATVNTGNLNVRSGPGVGYGILARASRGHVVALVGRNANSTWAQVVTFVGITGWVNASYIVPNVPISSLPITDGTASITGTLTGAYHLNVRSGPGVGYGVLVQIDYGAVVTVIGRNANSTWVQVRTASGITGWVNAYYLLFSSSIVNLPVTDGGVVNPPPQNPPPAGQTIHVVAAGENLYRISLRYGVSMYAIAEANGLLNLNSIYAGQRLVIP